MATKTKKSTKSKSTKNVAKEAKKPAPTSGQSAEPRQLHYTDLTPRERKVVNALAQPGRPVLHLSEIVDACGWTRPKPKDGELRGKALGNNRVRNQLRRLVPSEWVENAEERGKGTYRLTAKARDRLKRLATTPADGAAKEPHKRTKRAPAKEAPAVTEAHASEEF